MKAIGSFIIVLFILCVCFVKCTSDKTKLKIYQASDMIIQSQMEKCAERIEAEEDSISDLNTDIKTETNRRPLHKFNP